jgi:hypothetical protein
MFIYTGINDQAIINFLLTSCYQQRSGLIKLKGVVQLPAIPFVTRSRYHSISRPIKNVKRENIK